MRVMFDTNILISAVFYSTGKPSQSIVRSEQLGMELCICKEIRDEAFEKFEQKWPELLDDFKLFFTQAGFTVLHTPMPSNDIDDAVRDASWRIRRQWQRCGRRMSVQQQCWCWSAGAESGTCPRQFAGLHPVFASERSERGNPS
jgi:hypothetical protein